MVSGTATSTVLGPPIRPQPLSNNSAAALAAAGTDRPDLPASRTCPSRVEPASVIRSDRMRRRAPRVATPGESEVRRWVAPPGGWPGRGQNSAPRRLPASSVGADAPEDGLGADRTPRRAGRLRLRGWRRPEDGLGADRTPRPGNLRPPLRGFRWAYEGRPVVRTWGCRREGFRGSCDAAGAVDFLASAGKDQCREGEGPGRAWAHAAGGIRGRCAALRGVALGRKGAHRAPAPRAGGSGGRPPG
jgi:hypothetical protein